MVMVWLDAPHPDIYRTKQGKGLEIKWACKLSLIKTFCCACMLVKEEYAQEGLVLMCTPICSNILSSSREEDGVLILCRLKDSNTKVLPWEDQHKRVLIFPAWRRHLQSCPAWQNGLCVYLAPYSRASAPGTFGQLRCSRWGWKQWMSNFT